MYWRQGIHKIGGKQTVHMPIAHNEDTCPAMQAVLKSLPLSGRSLMYCTKYYSLASQSPMSGQ